MNDSASVQLVASDVWQARLFTGSWCAGTSEFDVTEPATGKRLGRIGMADASLVAASSAVAYAAQPNWATLPYEERAAVMRRAAKLTDTHRDEIVEWIVRESGSTRAKASA